MRLLLNASIVILALTFGKEALASKQEKLTNKHLVIAADPWPPYITMNVNEDGEVKAEGFFWDFVKFWLDARNCTYTLSISPYGTRGHCVARDNCIGSIGMVCQVGTRRAKRSRTEALRYQRLQACPTVWRRLLR